MATDPKVTVIETVSMDGTRRLRVTRTHGCMCGKGVVVEDIGPVPSDDRTATDDES